MIIITTIAKQKSHTMLYTFVSQGFSNKDTMIRMLTITK